MTNTTDGQGVKQFTGIVKGGEVTYSVDFTVKEPVTADLWCLWWEKRAEHLGPDPAKQNNVGAVLRAKYKAHLECMIVEGTYTNVKTKEVVELKKVGMSAPAEVVQWVNLQVDGRMAEVWAVPQPSSGRQPSQG